jgi:hypothetical protein
VNLGVDSGLTFSGDNIIINTTIAGNGLDFASGVLTVNTSEINTALAGNGLAANGSALDVNVANGLVINGDNVEINQTAAGNGLTFSAGVFAVNTANGLTINGDNVEINQTAAGNGLTFSAGVFAVNTANGLTTNGDNVEVAQTIAGQGLTFSSGVVDMVWGGTATGTTFSNDAVAVVVDGTTIQINTSGQLTVVAGASQPVYQNITAVNTTGNDAIVTGATVTSTPNDYSRIQVYVNGQVQRLGDANIVQDCYFGSSGTAKALANLTSGDQLYWNGNIAGFNLATSDKIDIVYEA